MTDMTAASTPPPIEPIEGCDASHYQGDKTDFAKVWRAGRRFVIFKATDGYDIDGPRFRSHVDQLYRLNRDRAGAFPFRQFAYTFVRPGDNLDGQVNSFLAMMEARTQPTGAMLDVEWTAIKKGQVEAWAARSRQDNTALVLEYQRRIHSRLGVWPVLYVGPEFLAAYMEPHPDLARSPLALARYSPAPPRVPAPWKRMSFWQYRVADLDGFPGPVDQDRFYGTLADLDALLSPPPPKP